MENRKGKNSGLIYAVMLCVLAAAMAPVKAQGPSAKASESIARSGMTGALLAAPAPSSFYEAEQGGPGSNGESLPEVLEAIEKARVTTRILYVTAHPDDEPGALLAYLARGLHADVALLALTRGEGGQNALGPEQAPQLGVLRTEELMNATRVYGTRLFFTRARDFGFSKSPEETIQVWGEQVLEDMVRVIRTFRPHVIINNWGGVRSGHGHHQASGILTPKAYAMAADPKVFPEQLKEGLPTWKAESLLQLSRGEASGGFSIPVSEVSPLWGKSWGEIGVEGYLNHRTQGVGGVRSSPFFRRAIGLVAAEGAKPDAAVLAAPLGAMGRRFPDFDDAGFASLMKKVEEPLAKAEASARELDWKTATQEIARAAHELEATRFDLGPQNGPAKEIATQEMREVMQRINNAIVAAAGLYMEATADRSDVVAGETFTVTVNWRKRSEAPMDIEGASLALPEGWSVTKEEKQQAGGVKFTIQIPKTNADERRLGKNNEEERKGESEEGSTAETQRNTEKAFEISDLKFERERQEGERKGGRKKGSGVDTQNEQPNSVVERARVANAPDGNQNSPAGSRRYAEWIYPWPDALVKARLKVKVGEHEFEAETEAVATRVTSVSSETRPIALVPAVTLTVEPKEIVVVSGDGAKGNGAQQAAPLQSGVKPPHSKEAGLPAEAFGTQTTRRPAPTESREIVVRVRHYATTAEKISVGIEAPQGSGEWSFGSAQDKRVASGANGTTSENGKGKIENRKTEGPTNEERSFGPMKDIGPQDDKKMQSGVKPPQSKAAKQASPRESGADAPHSTGAGLPPEAFGTQITRKAAPTESREIVVRVRHYATTAEKITVGIEAPQGSGEWSFGSAQDKRVVSGENRTTNENGKGKIENRKTEEPANEERSFGPTKSVGPPLDYTRGEQDDKKSQSGVPSASLGAGAPPQSTTVEFSGTGDELVRFAAKAPAKLAAGKYELKAWARRADGEEFRTSLEPLVTLPTRMWSEPAVAKVHVMDVTVPRDLRVGYVTAENDPIPEALREIGVRVELLDEQVLAFGDLSKYDAIAIGIRAYELRNDLARANQRLLDYAAAGGTLVVQYQREGVWNQLKPAPYPATIGNGLRTTDENSPVRVLEPLHTVLNFPNAIRSEDYSGWVQERGLYYWGTFDAKYTPLLAMRDPGEQETLGALVYARHGKGVYIYTGLSFFRQLPEGVPGAYRLFVNLLSQGRKK